MHTEPNFDQLYELLASQQGFFAAVQAKELGYSAQLQSYYVKTGQWLRKGRGIFKLKHFPTAQWQDFLYITYLWTLNREGVPEGIFSHGTALYLHNLSTYVPPVLDLTVPKHFRRHTSPGSLELHKRNINSSDFVTVRGLPITTPLRTIVDLLDTKQIDHDYILEGLKSALDRFLILPKQIREAKLSSAQRDRLMSALRRVDYGLIDEI